MAFWRCWWLTIWIVPLGPVTETGHPVPHGSCGCHRSDRSSRPGLESCLYCWLLGNLGSVSPLLWASVCHSVKGGRRRCLPLHSGSCCGRLCPSTPPGLAESSKVTSAPPCLTEESFVGKDLLGRFADLIRSGLFQLHLDSKVFPADPSIRFLQGDRVGTSPTTRFGCLEGFYRVSATSSAREDPLGCGRSTCLPAMLLEAPGGFRKGHWGLRSWGVGNPCVFSW